MSIPTLLTISGSLRKGSYNRMLLKEAATAFGPAEVVEANLHLPLYDGDLEAAEGIPASVQTLAGQVKAADAIVIASPEYNKGISGVLKNALDWVSRVKGRAFQNKPVVVVSAASGLSGGEAAQFMTLSCLTQLQVQFLPGTAVLTPAAHDAFDDTGALKDEQRQETLTMRMQALRALVT